MATNKHATRMTFYVKDAAGRKHRAHAIVPDRTPNPGTSHRYSSIEAEFKARFLAGRTGPGRTAVGADEKLDAGLRHFSKYMKRHEGQTSGDTLKKEHYDRFKQFLTTQPSILAKGHGKSKAKLADKTVKDVLGAVRKVLYCYNREHYMKETYSAIGLKVAHSNLENPLVFAPDHLDRRTAVQLVLENKQARALWQAVVSQMGQAFGTRTAERIESRHILIRNADGTYLSTAKTKKFTQLKPITEKQLAKAYGHKMVQLARKMESGVPHLMVEDAKGDRNRPMPINNPARQAAVARLHAFIDGSPKHAVHRKPYPDGMERVKERAKEAYRQAVRRAGGTRKAQLNSYADRHFEAQRMWRELRTAGLSKWEAAQIIVDHLGHDSKEKIRYYINMSEAL